MSLLLVIGVEFFPPSRFLVSDNVFFSLWLILADNFAFADIEDLPTSILGHFRRFNPCRDQLCCGNHKSQKRSKTDNCFLEGGGGRAPSRCITFYNESRCMQRRLGCINATLSHSRRRRRRLCWRRPRYSGYTSRKRGRRRGGAVVLVGWAHGCGSFTVAGPAFRPNNH